MGNYGEIMSDPNDDDDYAYDNWKDQQLDKKYEEEMKTVTLELNISIDHLKKVST